jgi:hypothetical protein
MRLDEGHPLNAGVLRHLRDRQAGHGAPPVAGRGSHPDPYMKAGSHPDVVERVWDVLGPALPADCRALVYGAPALVHPVEGIVLAVCFGTRYAIRVPLDSYQAALAAGCTTEREQPGGVTTTLHDDLGPGWVFGGWASGEKQWLAQAYRECAPGR